MPKRPTQTPIPTRECPACGATMHMAESPTGALIPLVKIRTLYVRPAEMNEPRVVKATILDSTEKYVNHFETCTDPERFTKKKKSQ